MRRYLMLILTPLFLGLGLLEQSAQPVAAQTSAPIMIIYDSKDVSHERAQVIDRVVQWVQAAGHNTELLRMDRYRAGMLKRSSGLVTVNNWAETTADHPAFDADLKQYTKQHLHVGPRLAPSLAKQLQVTTQMLTRQQLLLTDAATGVNELIPFTAHQDVIQTHRQGTLIGQLENVSTEAKMPYAVVNQRWAWLPTVPTSAASQLLGAQVVAKWLNVTAKSAPLLVLQGVTPYSSQAALLQTAKRLAKAQVPFAVSAAAVYSNTELPEFEHYAASLRQVQLLGGMVLMAAPALQSGLGKATSTTIREAFTKALAALVDVGVYPVGLSMPPFWNQDQVLSQLVNGADLVVLEPSPAVPLHLGKATGLAARPVMGSVSLPSLFGKQAQPVVTELDSALPLAVTVALPANQAAQVTLMDQVNRLHTRWLDLRSDWQGQFTSGNVSVGVSATGLTVNHQPVSLTAASPLAITTAEQAKAAMPWYNRFFKAQSRFLWGFFAIAFIVMAVLIAKGRKVYKQMYERKGGR